jgi:hypothetical protein
MERFCEEETSSWKGHSVADYVFFRHFAMRKQSRGKSGKETRDSVFLTDAKKFANSREHNNYPAFILVPCTSALYDKHLYD